MKFTISREVQFDAGHRIPNHTSKCRSPHGHRYRVQAVVEADTLVETPTSEEGMVTDFGTLKDLLNWYVHDPLDHGFIVWVEDTKLMEAFQGAPTAMDDPFNYVSDGWKIIQFPYVPTAENIAAWCFEQLEQPIRLVGTRLGNEAKLVRIDVWETPTSVASVEAEPNKGQATMNVQVR